MKIYLLVAAALATMPTAASAITVIFAATGGADAPSTPFSAPLKPFVVAFDIPATTRQNGNVVDVYFTRDGFTRRAVGYFNFTKRAGTESATISLQQSLFGIGGTNFVFDTARPFFRVLATNNGRLLAGKYEAVGPRIVVTDLFGVKRGSLIKARLTISNAPIVVPAATETVAR